MDLGNIKELIQAGTAVISTTIAIIVLVRQRKQAERLKTLESELDKAKFEHQTRFTKLHDKRAEVIAELYRKIVILEIWMIHIISECELPNDAFTSPEGFAEDFEPVFGQISLELQYLASYFNLNRLYFDEAICAKIVNFHHIVANDDDPIYGFFCKRFNRMTKENILDIYGDNLKDRAYEFLELIADSRRTVENEFRQLLGINNGEVYRPNPMQANDDLMWIPDPRIIDNPIKWPRQPEEDGADTHPEQ